MSIMQSHDIYILFMFHLSRETEGCCDIFATVLVWSHFPFLIGNCESLRFFTVPEEGPQFKEMFNRKQLLRSN